MTDPGWTRRFLDYWARNPSPIYAPEASTWHAACPTCHADSEWWSGRTTTGLVYRITCLPCGTTEWNANTTRGEDQR